jgi:ubiquinone/menaquinone biosynthesis C-methylase UbiE
MGSEESKGHFEEEAKGYFNFLAKVGLTKHLGSMEATRELIELCCINNDQYVLEIGCGVGATVRYLAKTVGCRVVGVDVVERMIEQARDRVGEEVGRRVQFAVGDAQKLPFEDGLFDAVIMESVNVFFDDKQEAMREYVRVTKPGGYVGITEMTWLAAPSAEVEKYYERVVYAKAREAEGWKELLETAGLEQVVGSAKPVDLLEEARGRVERYGCRGIVRVLWRSLGLFVKDRETRGFLKDVTESLPQDLIGDMGYGVFAGQKRAV